MTTFELNIDKYLIDVMNDYEFVHNRTLANVDIILIRHMPWDKSVKNMSLKIAINTELIINEYYKRNETILDNSIHHLLEFDKDKQDANDLLFAIANRVNWKTLDYYPQMFDINLNPEIIKHQNDKSTVKNLLMKHNISESAITKLYMLVLRYNSTYLTKCPIMTLNLMSYPYKYTTEDYVRTAAWVLQVFDHTSNSYV